MKQSSVDRQYKNNLFIYLFTKKKEYAQFVEVVRRNSETMDMHEAMVRAIGECLKAGILVEFLQEYGKELEEMCWERYDTERILQIQHEEALEDAREEGIRLGLERGIERGRAEERSVAEKTILALQQEIELLKGQLAPNVR